jgi:hypothetical protein
MKASATYAVLFLVMFAPKLSLAQATFGFFNYVASVGLDAPVFDSEGNRVFGTSYLAVLYGGPSVDSLQLATDGNSSMDPQPIIRVINGQPGYFGQGGFVTIDNVPSGGYAWLQVRAWDARLGATYEEVARLGLGGYGESSLFYTYGGELIATGRPPQPLRGLESFSLVPEPATWALLVLGGGFLFWRWRRTE